MHGVSGCSVVEGKCDVKFSSAVRMSLMESVDNTACSVSDVESPPNSFSSGQVVLGSFQTEGIFKASAVSVVGERGGLVIARSRRLFGRYGSNCLRNKFCFGEGLRTPVHGWEGVAGGLHEEYIQLSRLSPAGT